MRRWFVAAVQVFGDAYRLAITLGDIFGAFNMLLGAIVVWGLTLGSAWVARQVPAAENLAWWVVPLFTALSLHAVMFYAVAVRLRVRLSDRVGLETAINKLTEFINLEPFMKTRIAKSGTPIFTLPSSLGEMLAGLPDLSNPKEPEGLSEDGAAVIEWARESAQWVRENLPEWSSVFSETPPINSVVNEKAALNLGDATKFIFAWFVDQHAGHLRKIQGELRSRYDRAFP